MGDEIRDEIGDECWRRTVIVNSFAWKIFRRKLGPVTPAGRMVVMTHSDTIKFSAFKVTFEDGCFPGFEPTQYDAECVAGNYYTKTGAKATIWGVDPKGRLHHVKTWMKQSRT